MSTPPSRSLSSSCQSAGPPAGALVPAAAAGVRTQQRGAVSRSPPADVQCNHSYLSAPWLSSPSRSLIHGPLIELSESVDTSGSGMDARGTRCKFSPTKHTPVAAAAAAVHGCRVKVLMCMLLLRGHPTPPPPLTHPLRVFSLHLKLHLCEWREVEHLRSLLKTHD